MTNDRETVLINKAHVGAPKPRLPNARGATLSAVQARSMWLGLATFSVVMFIRPQDIVPGLGAIKLGMLSACWMLFAWFASSDRDHLSDTIFKLFWAFIAGLVASIVVVINHHDYFWTIVDMTMDGVAYFLVLPAVLRWPEFREKFFRLMLCSYIYIAIWVITHGGRGPGAFLGDENDAAVALNVGIGICFAVWRCEQAARWRAIGLFGMAMCTIGVVATESRGGFLGMAAAYACIVMLTGNVARSLVVVAIALALSLPFVPERYLSDVKSISDTKDETRLERIYSWNRAIDLFWTSPLVGVGVSQFPWRVGDVEQSVEAIKERRGKRSISGRAVHSMYFQLIPEAGMVGVSVFLALFFVSIGRALRALRNSAIAPDPARRLVATAILAGFPGLMVSGTFVSVLYYPHFWLLCAFAILLSPKATWSLGEVRWINNHSQRGRRVPP